MTFVDEAIIRVEAGHGGHGAMSFRREKFIPFGGPDGGDGGDGGSVFIAGNLALNTLKAFRYQRLFLAKRGQDGKGQKCSGKKGDDIILPVPLGTMVYDNDTQELLGDITVDKQRLKVAQGGYHGLGNVRFKSSVQRAPQRTTKGTLGEVRTLRLELKLLADVGLVGLPNAGKSTLVSTISAAKPKVADYPFTTLQPSLGVVNIDNMQSFVVADIPGLISHAAQGAGLGIAFLKHLTRTKLLLHLVDLSVASDEELIASVMTIEDELSQFSDKLAVKPRWLVLTKADTLTEIEYHRRYCLVKETLPQLLPILTVAAVNGYGIDKLICRLGHYLKTS